MTSTRNAGIARRQILNSFTDGRQTKKIIFSQKEIQSLPVQLVQQGDNGNGKQPEPEEKVELLVDDIVRQHAEGGR